MFRSPKTLLNNGTLQPRSIRPKLLAVSSGGGHWVQLLRIKRAFEDCEVTFVTVHELYRAQVPDHKFYLVNDANIRTKFGLLKAASKLAWIIWNVKARYRGFDGCRSGIFGAAVRTNDGCAHYLARQHRQRRAAFVVGRPNWPLRRPLVDPVASFGAT